MGMPELWLSMLCDRRDYYGVNEITPDEMVFSDVFDNPM
jgi:hypothetical protein